MKFAYSVAIRNNSGGHTILFIKDGYKSTPAEIVLDLKEIHGVDVLWLLPMPYVP